MGQTKTDQKIETVSSFINKRRDPRIRFKPLYRVQFTTEKDNKKQNIFNVSASGIGIEITPKSGFKSNDMIKGEIDVNGDKFTIEAKVAHLSETVAGCEIVDPPDHYRDAITKYFQVEIAALNLKLEEENLDESVNHKIYYFTGGNNCELTVVESPDELIRYKVMAFGNVLTGGKDRDVEAGQVVSDTDFDDFSRDGVYSITRTIPSIDSETAVAINAFVENIEYLDEEYKTRIQNDIQGFPKN